MKAERTQFTYGVAKGLEFPEKILSKGLNLTYGFSKNLPPEWILQRGAKITSTLPGGRKGAGLEIANKQTASLIFGNDEKGLPVRITMSVFDNGEKHGGSSVNGSGWGVFGSNGEFYGPVLFWRKYLGTDSNHSWISTEKVRLDESTIRKNPQKNRLARMDLRFHRSRIAHRHVRWEKGPLPEKRPPSRRLWNQPARW